MGTCGDKGSIIVTTSAAATRPLASPGVHLGVYAATKAGADMLMKYGAIEVSKVAPRLFNFALAWRVIVPCSHVSFCLLQASVLALGQVQQP